MHTVYGGALDWRRYVGMLQWTGVERMAIMVCEWYTLPSPLVLCRCGIISCTISFIRFMINGG